MSRSSRCFVSVTIILSILLVTSTASGQHVLLEQGSPAPFRGTLFSVEETARIDATLQSMQDTLKANQAFYDSTIKAFQEGAAAREKALQDGFDKALALAVGQASKPGVTTWVVVGVGGAVLVAVLALVIVEVRR